MLGISARAAVSGRLSRHTNYSEFDISRPRAATPSRIRSHFNTVEMEEGWWARNRERSLKKKKWKMIKGRLVT